MPPEDSPLAGSEVSVIVPAYKSAATIGRTLASIGGQTVQPREVIVVDDGSGDDTARAAERARGRLGGVELVLLCQDNKGPGAARNLALSKARGSLVAFLDADDEWFPEKLEHSLRAMADPDTILVAHDIVVEKDGVETRLDCARHLGEGADPFVALFKRGFISTSTVLARRDIVLQAGGFDESLLSGQDFELWLSIARRRQGNFRIFPEALTRYHVLPDSVTSHVARRRDCALRIASRHWTGLRGRTPFAALVFAERIAIISCEAALANSARGHKLRALGNLLSMPVALLVGFMNSGHEISAGDARALRNARQAAETAGQDALGRNRQWWEDLPMTYLAWSDENRIPESKEDFLKIRALLLDNSPFMREVYDFGARKGQRVLDLGCGSGVFSCLLAEAGAHVTAADLTEAAVRLTRSSASAFGCPIPVARINAENTGFADASFDYVFSWGVLHHTPTPMNAYREVERILKPGGGGIIMVYHKNSAVYYLLGLNWLFFRGKIFAGYNLETVQGFFTDGFYHRNYTRRALADELTAAGLGVTQTIVTQMEKKILPGIPKWLDRFLKPRIGWLLIAYVTKSREN